MGRRVGERGFLEMKACRTSSAAKNFHRGKGKGVSHYSFAQAFSKACEVKGEQPLQSLRRSLNIRDPSHISKFFCLETTAVDEMCVNMTPSSVTTNVRGRSSPAISGLPDFSAFFRNFHVKWRFSGMDCHAFFA